MRIAVSAVSTDGLQSEVSPHFGQCPYYALIDLDGQQVHGVTMVANPYYGNHQPGQIPAFIRDQGANVMVSGGMGARATSFFTEYGIQVATGASGTVEEALALYLNGELSGDAACPGGHDHHAGSHGSCR
jgi:predicted Fe-Mo cluster-binding NifX family protein